MWIQFLASICLCFLARASATDVRPTSYGLGGWIPVQVDDEDVKAAANRVLLKLNTDYDNQEYHLGLVKIHGGIYSLGPDYCHQLILEVGRTDCAKNANSKNGDECELLRGNERHAQNFTATIYRLNFPENEWEVFITGLDGIPSWIRDYLRQWTFFKSTFGKQYSSEEDQKRKALFLETVEAIDRHNAAYERGEFTYSLGINKIADWTKEERKSLTGFRLPPNIDELRAKHTKIVEWTDEEPIPESIDWREKGYVTEAKDQSAPHRCGSCWAFSSTGHLEGRLKGHTGDLVSLSEQNLMDCLEGDGCTGHWQEKAFEYVIKNGIKSEKDYPYEADDKPCRHNSSKALLKDLQTFHIAKEDDEEQLKMLIAKYGPISISFAMKGVSIPMHQEGVYYNPNCSTKINHAMTAVGYGHDEKSGLDYWLIKNSWGKDFGENGYFKTARNKGNMCKVASHSVFVLFDGEEES